MRNSLCREMGIEFPIFAFSHCRDVVAAVSRAGGFGVLGAATSTPEQLDVELRWIDEAVEGKPYGIDVLVPQKLAGISTNEGSDGLHELIPDSHWQFLDKLLQKHGVALTGASDDEGPAPGDLAVNFTSGGAMPLIEAALAHPVRLVANALGAPPPELLEAAHSRDIPVAALIGTPEHAERQLAAGVDIIVAQGYEAGGHTGEIATMVLVPEIVDAVAPRPVLAAGGIASGRQMAAALALGAQGVWTGSIWLSTKEAETHPVVLEKFLAARASDTVRSRSLTGKPARQLRSAWTDAWDGPDSPGPLPMPLQPLLAEYARRRIYRAAAAGSPGAKELINYFVGQVVGSFHTVRPARQVVLEIIEEYIDVVDELFDRLST